MRWMIAIGLMGCLASRAGVAEDMLMAHNTIRAKVVVAPLEWSDQLAKHAEEWARTLIAQRDFVHRPNNPYGENLFAMTGATATPAQVVTYWASEARDY